METGPHTRGPSAIRPSGQAWYSHRTGARRGRPDVRYAKLDMEANGCVLHSGHHKILCPWATRGRYQWWRPEGYLSQVHTQLAGFCRVPGNYARAVSRHPRPHRRSIWPPCRRHVDLAVLRFGSGRITAHSESGRMQLGPGDRFREVCNLRSGRITGRLKATVSGRKPNLA